MKTLVTGASGFLGTSLVRTLLAQTQEPIRCLVRSNSGVSRLSALSDEYGKDRIEFCLGDLTRKNDAAEAVAGSDTIYHVAAGTTGSTADMFYNTVVGSKNLLDALTGNELKRVVLISSFSVYGVSGLEPRTVVNEQTPLEKYPEQRDPYAYTKLRQEQLFWEYRDKHGIPLVVIRPGVIYGPGGTPITTRVGINVFGLFLHLGRNNLLPLTYVDNCCEAIVTATRHETSVGEVYNVVDDDLPTSKDFLRAYRRQVRRMKYITLPYFALRTLSGWVAWYNKYSKGQLPAILTPYKTSCNWKGTLFENTKLKSIGWLPSISTTEGLTRFFTYLKENG
jgi:nucleoside-diphosphate-sugar epimerase